MKSAADKPELLAPAGNLEKLTFAVKYGADAVYFGGDEFNLRVRAGNFSPENIEKSLQLCREHNVRTVFLMNSFLHEGDLEAARKYINEIKKFKLDAIMVSDPGMLTMLQDTGVEAEFHLSTQMNTLNHLAADFWKRAGFSRIVLARETTIDEIRAIRENSDVELEVFAHGALCVAYSGRCLLSRYMTGRDANQGDCSQPCRWNYKLVEEKRPGNYLDVIEHQKGTEIISSKDLNTIHRVEEFIDAGVSAFKIEGRMKSLYHAANTTRIYKHAIQCAGTDDFNRNLSFWQEELDLINHRPYTDDLFNEFNNLEFTGVPYVRRALFLGYKSGSGDDKRQALIKTSNPIRTGEDVEAIFPIDKNIKDGTFTIREIHDMDGNIIEMARPSSTCMITFDRDMDDNAILRRREETGGDTDKAKGATT